MRIFKLVPLLFLAGLGCTQALPTSHSAAASPHLVRPGTPASVDIGAARQKGGQRAFTWQSWSPDTFAKAARENRFILLDGAAEWCHWCHVMDETTYMHPEVGKLLHERFVAIRVDIDERPDLAERYGDWGWPATIILTPDAREIGKYRGYLPPDELLAILRNIDTASLQTEHPKKPTVQDLPAHLSALTWIGARVMLDMDDYFDPKEASWGRRQKSPLGANVQFELVRAAHGDEKALKRATFTLQKQRALIDPVWGGVYQYSAGNSWNEPHFEKLMPYQTANIEAYSRAYIATKNPAFLADANKIADYLNTFLSNAEGAFLVSQDADVGAHDRNHRFVDGHVYYSLDDAGRRALGIPRIDDNVYGYENGLAIAAFCTLYEASRDPAVIQRARRAADLLLKTHLRPDGSIKRPNPTTQGMTYLPDQVSLGYALARLAEITADTVYKDAALQILAAMRRDLEDRQTGTYFANTPDPAAAGIFAERSRPVVHNVLAARFFAALARITGDVAMRERARTILAAIASPRALMDQGRMLGEFLLALDEAGAIMW